MLARGELLYSESLRGFIGHVLHSHCSCVIDYSLVVCFFFQAEDGIRDLVRSRGLGDVYKRQVEDGAVHRLHDVKLHQFQPVRVADQVNLGQRDQPLSLIHI